MIAALPKIRFRTARRTGLIILTVAGLSVAIIALSLDVATKLRSMNVARSDNVQWSLSRLEVELLLLQQALQDAEGGGGTELAEVRRQFDIFFSRVSTIDKGAPYQRLRQSPEFAEPLDQIIGFLDDSVPVIDSGDAALLGQVPAMSEEVTDLRENVRVMTLQGLEQFALMSDQRRNEVTATLLYLAGTTAGLILALLLLAAILNRTSRLSAKRAAEQRLLASRMRAIIGSSLDAVVVAGDDGRVRVFNGAAERVFGYSEAEAVGQSLESLIIPEKYAAAHAAGMQRFARTREKRVVGAGRVELEGKRKSGETFPVELSIDMAESDDETIFVSYLRDITDRRKAEQELMETRDRALAGEKAKAEFLAVMSHEMRTPLNGLLGTLSLLRETELTPRQTTFLDNMDASGQLLLHHVNDVLDISKLEAGHVRIENAPFDLDDLLSDLIAGQSGVATAHGNSLAYHWLSEPPGIVRGDSVRLRQVLLNLVGNAIKFTQGGEVRVEAEQIGGDRRPTFEFRVIDNGIGISEADMERIFDDFETLDSSYGRVAGGTGLGLGISRRLVEAMNGEIGAESEKGEGSLFWIRVPLDLVAESGTPAGSPEQARELARLDVLIVEDNEINRQVLEGMLLQDGHSVTQAVNGKEGVEAAAARAFDVILMDVSMPVMDGVTATRAIRGGDGPCREVPILAVTAHAMAGDREAFRDAGMSGLVTKPIVRAELRETLERFGNPPPLAGSPSTGTDAGMEDRFSPETLSELIEAVGPDRAAMLMANFIEEMDQGVDTLVSDEQSGADLADLVTAAHKMAGSCGTFGATRLRKRLSDIETQAKTGDEDHAREGIRTLRSHWREDRRHFERKQATMA